MGDLHPQTSLQTLVLAKRLPRQICFADSYTSETIAFSSIYIMDVSQPCTQEGQGESYKALKSFI